MFFEQRRAKQRSVPTSFIREKQKRRAKKLLSHAVGGDIKSALNVTDLYQSSWWDARKFLVSTNFSSLLETSVLESCFIYCKFVIRHFSSQCGLPDIKSFKLVNLFISEFLLLMLRGRLLEEIAFRGLWYFTQDSSMRHSYSIARTLARFRGRAISFYLKGVISEFPVA